MALTDTYPVRERSMRAKLAEVSRAMHQLASGDDTATIPENDGWNDEIGVLIEAATKFRSALVCSREFAAIAEQERERLHAAVSNMPIGLSMFDRSERLIICNDAFCKMYGLSWEMALPGVELNDLYTGSPAFGACATDALAEYRIAVAESVTKKRSVLKLLELPDRRTLSYCVSPMEAGGWIAVHEDITERRHAEERISHMAKHDALTDLPNRLYFKEQMEQALERLPRGESLAVICLDLDHFKDVNDTLGHPVGDRLLTHVATRLKESVRGADIVARFGGDEFAIVQVGVRQPEGSVALAGRIIDAISEPYEFDGQQIVIGVSAGLAIAPADGSEPDTLLKNSDMALYFAKAEGRGTFRFFDAEMDARLQARRWLELELRQAVEQDQFDVYYQPVIEPRSRKIVSFEALLRWRHPERGIVAPDEFIPLAEEIGLIVPMGASVLRRACCDAMAWPEDVSVAVNISAIQFKNADLLEQVVTALAVSKLPARRLELEITESVLLINTQAILSILQQLHGLGVRIVMDDFGTGYSSLSYLRQFPFDRIKIDRSFVGEMPQNGNSLAVIRAVAGLGRNLAMQTTAEGVETQEQLDLLCAEGINAVQGFLFAPARPLAEATALLRSCPQEIEQTAA